RCARSWEIRAPSSVCRSFAPGRREAAVPFRSSGVDTTSPWVCWVEPLHPLHPSCSVAKSQTPQLPKFRILFLQSTTVDGGDNGDNRVALHLPGQRPSFPAVVSLIG